MKPAVKKHRFLNVLFLILVTLIMLWLVVASAFLTMRTLAAREERLPALFGYQISAEMSAGMGTIVPVGSVVLTTEQTELTANDVILYKNADGILSTGRILESQVIAGHMEYETVYDIAENLTEKVMDTAVLGRVAYTVPYGGYVLNYLADFQGVLVAVLVPCAVLIIVLAIRIIYSFRTRRDQEEDLGEDEPAAVPFVQRAPRQNEELDRVWKKESPVGRAETDEIKTDQDMVSELSNLNNQLYEKAPAARETVPPRLAAETAARPLWGKSEPAKPEPKAKQPEPNIQAEPVYAVAEETWTAKPADDKAQSEFDYDRLIASLGLDNRNSSDLISMLREYGLSDEEEAASVQKAAPFMKPVMTEHGLKLDLSEHPAQKVSVVSDDHGKFLIVESGEVETKIKLPF